MDYFTAVAQSLESSRCTIARVVVSVVLLYNGYPYTALGLAFVLHPQFQFDILMGDGTSLSRRRSSIECATVWTSRLRARSRPTKLST